MVQQSKEQRNVCALRCQKLATQKQLNAKTLLCFLDWFMIRGKLNFRFAGFNRQMAPNDKEEKLILLPDY